MDVVRRGSAILLAAVLGACHGAESPAGPGTESFAVTGTTLSSVTAPEIFTGAGNIGDCGWIYDDQTGQLLDSLPGTIAAAMLIGILESLGAGYLDPLLGGGFGNIASYLLMMAMLMARPQGLFGQPPAVRV